MSPDSLPLRGVLVAGAGSGSGKTLATLALLAGLRERGREVLPYKCGPDFIDPRHHERVALTPSKNLDLHFTPPALLRESFDRDLSGTSGAVVEGVMGLFDGMAGGRSTFDIARVLGLPIVLVLSARGMAETAAALVQGLVSFREGGLFAGVIATRTGSERHREMIARALEEADLPPLLGVLPRDEALTLPERYLGLCAPGEAGEDAERGFLERLAEHARRFDWERILPFFSEQTVSSSSKEEPGSSFGQFLSSLRERALRDPAPDFFGASSSLPDESEGGKTPARGAGKGRGGSSRPRLAVALDRAFWFYYHENFESLGAAGVEIVFFSPLEDPRLPPGTQGLYLGGGYPERFAGALSRNRSMIDSVREFCHSGRPVYAECGGMLYLTQGPEGEGRGAEENHEEEGKTPQEGEGREIKSPLVSPSLVGVLPVRYRLGERLRRLGYAEVRAGEGLFSGVPGTLRGHLFHYTTLAGKEALPGRRRPEEAQAGPAGKESPAFLHAADGRPEGWALGGVAASYMHAFFPTNPHFAARLAESLRLGESARSPA